MREELGQNATTDLVSIFSWNILANSMALTRHGRIIYSNCAAETVPWAWRMPRILTELASVKADIIMLQEVEPEFYADQLAPLMQACGYEGEYEIRNKTTANEVIATIPSCATFYQSERFALAWKELPFRGLVLGLQLKQGPHKNAILAIANSHLEGHPERTTHRHNQIRSVWKRIDKRQPEFMVLGGDYNDGAGSELCREHMRGLRNAYNGSVARDATCVVGVNPDAHKDYTRVDHLFVDEKSIVLRGLQNVMHSSWDRDAVLAAGLPGHVCPSDHLSIAVVAELVAFTKHASAARTEVSADEPCAAELLASSPLSEDQMEVWKALREASSRPSLSEIKGLSAEEKRELTKRMGMERKEQRQAFLASLESDDARAFVKQVESKLKQEAKAQAKMAKQAAAERQQTDTK
ncbi:Glucose-repressible alcohol dehydrogenase transcriptional effector [Hondaea fermentalgiana]|uniref:Glucose-repressible alcohol dehydrogenase transcriptional effector n=1 Tax=Hondaea fermentalgiana TaxID=2315210 RepID=A0A2R5GTM9_9STRA|nr:Glucose-repressible alcohol dehydrogenase transcriptional effector [Hondaea fermentalgiana]|eukprot:GBG32003.1 Glucose-repressible alcohol dehydrogenase transcriptional effector [Hondaea fermentalgiana]